MEAEIDCKIGPRAAALKTGVTLAPAAATTAVLRKRRRVPNELFQSDRFASAELAPVLSSQEAIRSARWRSWKSGKRAMERKARAL
jgi:hypothetical protein